MLLAVLMAIATAIAGPQQAGGPAAGYTAALLAMACLTAATVPLGVRLSAARPERG